jgi:hypothetical protein
MPPQEEESKYVPLNGPLFVISEKNGGIPAVELLDSGNYVVLLFTSEAAAKRYCYLRQPDAVENIIELPRRTDDQTREVIQAGLIRIARQVRKERPEITHFLIDHPGTRGHAMYASVDDVAYLGRKPVPRDIANQPEKLLDFLATIEAEEREFLQDQQKK